MMGRRWRKGRGSGGGCRGASADRGGLGRLCPGGLVATWALTVEPSEPPRTPAGEPAPDGGHAVDCREIAASLARDRAEAERRRQEALDPSEGDPYVVQSLVDVAAPAECADEIEALD